MVNIVIIISGDGNALEGELFISCIVVVRARAGIGSDCSPLTDNGVFASDEDIGGSLDGGDGSLCDADVLGIFLCGKTKVFLQGPPAAHLRIAFCKSITGIRACGELVVAPIDI